MATFYEIGDLIVTEGAVHQVEGILGRGGMARVYLARALKLNRLVVIKVLNPEIAASHPVLAKAFDAEASALAQMTSEHLPNVTAHGRTIDDRSALYYTMDRIPGHSLKHLLSYHLTKHGTKKLRIDQALNLASQIAQGLGKVHDYGVVHCDIKPDNVFLYRSEEGQTKIKIIDFGIMIVHDEVRSRRFMGTVPYAAPEQLEESDLGPATDIFALGLVTFELLTGALAYEGFGGEYEDGLRRVKVEASLLSEHGVFPPALTVLLQRMLSLDPARRPDAFAVAGELRKIGRELAPVNPHEVMTDPNLGGLVHDVATEMRPLTSAEVHSTDVDVDFAELMRRVEAERVAQEVGDTEPGAPGRVTARVSPAARSTAEPAVPPTRRGGVPARIQHTARMVNRPSTPSPSEVVTSPPSVELPPPASDGAGVYLEPRPAGDRAPVAQRQERVANASPPARARAAPRPESRSPWDSLRERVATHARDRAGRAWLIALAVLVGMMFGLAVYGVVLVVRPQLIAGLREPSSAAAGPVPDARFAGQPQRVPVAVPPARAPAAAPTTRASASRGSP